MKINHNKIFFLTLVLFTVVTGIMTVYRAHSGSNDFDTFYYAGRAVLDSDGLYYIDEYYSENPKIGPFLYPPFAACFFALLAWLPLTLAAFLWNILALACFGLSFVLIGKLFSSSNEHMQQAFFRLSRWDQGLLLVFLISVFLDNLAMAQANLFVVFLCLAGLALFLTKRPFFSGLVFAAAVGIKLSPLLFFVYFLFKRQWRLLAGFVLGGILCTAIIPILFLGFETNILYHRQFLGRTIKPMAIEFLSVAGIEVEDRRQERPGAERHFNSFSERVSHNRLTGRLVDKNQALEAALTRVLLRDRQSLGTGSHPIYVAQDYEKMPVLFGGIKQAKLNVFIRVLQGLLFFGFVFIFLFPVRKDRLIQMNYEYGLIFLSMTLFAPLARSHQSIFWLLPVLAIFYFWRGEGDSRNGKGLLAARLAIVVYLMQALPYGKAAGFGAWANLILWAVLFGGLLQRGHVQDDT